LSKRTPALAVRRSLSRQVSFTNPECVRKAEPSLSSRIGFHWMVVVPSPRKIGERSFSPAPLPERMAPALRMR